MRDPQVTLIRRRLLVVATNVGHYANSTLPTGLWLSELVHFWNIVTAHGFQAEIVSPAGGAIPIDPVSLGFFLMDGESKRAFQNRDFMQQLENTASLQGIDPQDYDAIYLTGGHGTMWDFAENQGLHQLVRKFYESNKIVSAVCHGNVGLIHVTLSNGELLIRDKKVTGYSWLEEQLAKRATVVPFRLESEMKKRGAHYRKSMIPFMPFVVVDGRLVTGQNPFSSKKVAAAVLGILNG